MDRDASAEDDAATLQLVVFLIDAQRYALPLATVLQVLPMVAVSSLPHAPPITLGVINLHGTVVPVLDVRQRFGLPPREYGVGARLLAARATRRLVALPVDEVLGVSAVAAPAITPSHTILPQIDYIAGIVTLDDGLLFIQDLDAFLFPDEEQQLSDALVELART